MNVKNPNVYDYNPPGKWSVALVQQRYAQLCDKFGTIEGFELQCRTYTNYQGASWIYNIMQSVVDGLQLGCKACIELSVQYIEDSPMSPHSGYIRERMARALRHVDLSDSQKLRLSEIFMLQLKSHGLKKEFREYIRLFKIIGIEPYRKAIEKHRHSSYQYIDHAAQRLLHE